MIDDGGGQKTDCGQQTEEDELNSKIEISRMMENLSVNGIRAHHAGKH